MEKDHVESKESSETLTALCSKLTGLTNRDYSPNHQGRLSNDNPSNSSPKAPNSDKALTLDKNSPKTTHSSKVQAIVEALVGEQKNHTQKETNDRINEIDSFITKILDKLKIEKQRISDIESTRASLRSISSNEKERHQEQENLEPVSNQQDTITETGSSTRSGSTSARSERSQRERIKLDPIKKSLNVLEPFKGQKYSINEILEISTHNINFGVSMPGKIIEEPLDITNNSDEDIVVQICIDCHNAELNETEEYIYSIRRSHLYDYNDKHYLIMSPRSTASFKITLKVPNTRDLKEIMGDAKIAIRGVKGLYKIPLATIITIPKVICPKELYHHEGNARVIKLAIKQGKKQDSKFPLRNLSDSPVSLELDFYQPPNIIEDEKFQCLIHPSVVNIPPSGTALVNITLKSLKTLGRIDIENVKSFRKVLIGRARNSTLLYSFPLWIEIC